MSCLMGLRNEVCMILPKMRRVGQSLSNEEIVDALCASSTGVLAVIGENGYPYTVPLTYAYDAQENVFWFHSKKSQ